MCTECLARRFSQQRTAKSGRDGYYYTPEERAVIDTAVGWLEQTAEQYPNFSEADQKLRTAIHVMLAAKAKKQSEQTRS